MRQKSMFVLLALGIVCIGVLCAGCTGAGPGQSATSPGAATASPKLPEQVVPLSVSGFSQELKYDHQEAVSPDAEYSAVGLYKPELNSTYEGQVAVLSVSVDKFVNTTSATGYYSSINGTQLTVSGYPGIYNYEPDFGIASLVVQKTNLVLESVAQSPDNVTSFNEPLLKDASVKGMEAAIKNL